MRTFNTSIASLVLRNADNGTSTVSLIPSNIPTDARIIEAKQPAANDAAVKAIIEADGQKRKAAQAAQANARKLSGAATGNGKAKPAAKPVAAKADKPSKPAASTEPAKPAIHETRSSYIGASPTFRHHGKKLSPIVLDRIPGSFTERDAAFLSDLYAAYGNKPFARFDADAGNTSRAIGHGYLKHVAGSLDSRTATFAITERYIRERQQSAKAKPASKR